MCVCVCVCVCVFWSTIALYRGSWFLKIEIITPWLCDNWFFFWFIKRPWCSFRLVCTYVYSGWLLCWTNIWKLDFISFSIHPTTHNIESLQCWFSVRNKNKSYIADWVWWRSSVAPAFWRQKQVGLWVWSQPGLQNESSRKARATQRNLVLKNREQNKQKNLK